MNCFKDNLYHDYDIRNIQLPSFSNIIVTVHLTVRQEK